MAQGLIRGWMVALWVMGLGGIGVPAIAAHSDPVAEALLPLENQEFSLEGTPDYAGVSEQINAITGNRKAEESSIPSFDPRTIPLVNRFLDEDSNLRLPLGLTVYTTLGDPSIGFGQRF